MSESNKSDILQDISVHIMRKLFDIYTSLTLNTAEK